MPPSELDRSTHPRRATTEARRAGVQSPVISLIWCAKSRGTDVAESAVMKLVLCALLLFGFVPIVPVQPYRIAVFN